jgi:hypothetical protein
MLLMPPEKDEIGGYYLPIRIAQCSLGLREIIKLAY